MKAEQRQHSIIVSVSQNYKAPRQRMPLATAVSPDSIISGPEPVILFFLLSVTKASYLWQITLFIIHSLHRYYLISGLGIIFGSAWTKYTGRD